MNEGDVRAAVERLRARAVREDEGREKLYTVRHPNRALMLSLKHPTEQLMGGAVCLDCSVQYSDIGEVVGIQRVVLLLEDRVDPLNPTLVFPGLLALLRADKVTVDVDGLFIVMA